MIRWTVLFQCEPQKRAISEGRSRLSREVYVPHVPAQFQHLFEPSAGHAGAQNIIAAVTDQEQKQRHLWIQHADTKFNKLETAIQTTSTRQEKLEGTAQAIVTSLDNVLAKIDKIQVAQGKAITDHDIAISAQQGHQKELAEATIITQQQQRQTAVETNMVQNRVSTTQSQVGQAEHAVKLLIEQQERAQAAAGARQTAHEMETLALKQQMQKLVEEQRIALDLARLTQQPPPPPGLTGAERQRRNSVMSDRQEQAHFFSPLNLE